MSVRLLLLVVACLLSGCGQEPEKRKDESGTHLTLLLPGGRIKAAAEDALADLHRDHPEITVEIITAPGKDYYVKGLAMMAAGADLDLLWMGQGFGLFAFRNALLDLAPLMAEDPDFDLETFYQPVVDWYRLGGELYGLPYGIDVQALAYNQDVFAEAGVPEPGPDWTFDDYLKTARTLTTWASQHEGPLRYGAGIDVIRPFYFDLKMVEGPETSFGFNTPAGREWLQLNVDLLVNEKSFLRVGAQGTLDRLGEFLQQRIAIVEAFSWDVMEFRKRAGFRWKLAPTPLNQSGRRVAWGSSSGFSIAVGTQAPEAAWTALTYLVAPKFQRQIMKETVPALLSLQAEYVRDLGLPGENLEVFLQLLPALEPTPRIAELLTVTSEWDYWMQLSLQGGQEPGDILNRAETSINNILEVRSPPR